MKRLALLTLITSSAMGGGPTVPFLNNPSGAIREKGDLSIGSIEILRMQVVQDPQCVFRIYSKQSPRHPSLVELCSDKNCTRISRVLAEQVFNQYLAEGKTK